MKKSKKFLWHPDSIIWDEPVAKRSWGAVVKNVKSKLPKKK